MAFLRDLFGGQARAAARDLERRLASFRSEIAAARANADRAVLEALRTRPAALGLTPDDADLELELLEGLIAVAELQEAVAGEGPLPVVENRHRALAGETCHFAAAAWRPDAAGDPGGKLFLTPRRLLYLGAPTVSLAWAHVADVRPADRDIVIRARPERLLAFRCNCFTDTLVGAWTADRLRRGVRNAS